jgi:hypothetical protein
MGLWPGWVELVFLSQLSWRTPPPILMNMDFKVVACETIINFFSLFI